MNNEELKKKIVEILEETEYEWTEEKNGYILQIFYDKLADALIAAGIGDVKTAQEIGASATAMAVLEAAKAEHRAARAERALKISSLKIATMIDEEVPACDVCENYQSCNLTVGACSEYMEKCCVEQAEKALAEEGKEW